MYLKYNDRYPFTAMPCSGFFSVELQKRKAKRFLDMPLVKIAITERDERKEAEIATFL